MSPIALCFALYASSRALTAAYRPFLDKMGITYPQYLVLLVLWERGPVPIKDLATSLHLDYGTLSPLVKRLERAGLVERTRRSDDERSVSVSPTAKARQLQPTATQMIESVIEDAGISLDEVADLRQRLEAFAAKIRP